LSHQGTPWKQKASNLLTATLLLPLPILAVMFLGPTAPADAQVPAAETSVAEFRVPAANVPAPRLQTAAPAADADFSVQLDTWESTPRRRFAAGVLFPPIPPGGTFPTTPLPPPPPTDNTNRITSGFRPDFSQIVASVQPPPQGRRMTASWQQILELLKMLGG